MQTTSLAICYDGLLEDADLEKESDRRPRTALDGPNAEAMQDHNRIEQLRILLIDLRTPTPDRDAGSVIAFELSRMLTDLDFQVSFLPRDQVFTTTYFAALQRRGIEVIMDWSKEQIENIAETRPNYYRYIVALRYGSLWDWYETLRRGYPEAENHFSRH